MLLMEGLRNHNFIIPLFLEKTRAKTICAGHAGSVDAGRTESACVPVGLVQLDSGRQDNVRERRDHHLGDAVAAVHGEHIFPGVEQDHADFAAVACVDGAGRIEQGHGVFECEPAAGSYLRLVTGGQLEEKPGRDERDLARRGLDVHAAFQVPGAQSLPVFAFTTG